MATIPRKPVGREPDYPTSDGRPMAETDWHRDLMLDLIETLKVRFASDLMVYVSGNLLVYYVRGDKRRHVSPDVFVVRGVPKRRRLYYLVWEEAKGPEAAIEITSKSTRNEDLKKKFNLYQDVLKVQEYFLFDPFEEYLVPSLQGYRLIDGKYVRIEPVAGRLPSEVLGLHLERDGSQLRLFDPATGQRLLTPLEMAQKADDMRRKAEAEIGREKTARRQAEAELERLRHELDALRRGQPKES